MARARDERRLYRGAAEGALTRESLALYLSNVHALVRHTPLHLSRAHRRAKEAGRETLVAHFAQKLAEEQGHDAWAEADLASVAAAGARTDLLPSMRDWLDGLVSIIDEDPDLYLAYILFAEYLTVLVGAEWLELLESRCGIPTSAMTVVANHVELDREHVDDALHCIDALVADPRKLPRMREVLRTSFAMLRLPLRRRCPARRATGNASAMFRLPDDWFVTERIADTIDAAGVTLHRAGIASRGPDGQELTGSGADVDAAPTARAEFELLERAATWTALSGARQSYGRLDARRTPAWRRLVAKEVFPESPDPARWCFSRSNGVALHESWQEACDRAHWEAIERERVLRSWCGWLRPAAISFDGAGGCALASTAHAWSAYRFGAPSAAHDLEVVGVFGFPRARRRAHRDRPMRRAPR